MKPELTKEYILGAINARNDSAVNALLGLYARQTADEQQSAQTSHENGMGFNGTDANILSSFAEQVQAKRAKGFKAGTELSPKQLDLLRKKLPKYSRQLLQIATEKQANRDASPEKGEETPRTAAKTCPDCDGKGGHWTEGRHEDDMAWADCRTCDTLGKVADSPLSRLPSGFLETENGWRAKTARDFYNEGVRLDLNIGSLPRRSEPLEPVSEFERCLMA